MIMTQELSELKRSRNRKEFWTKRGRNNCRSREPSRELWRTRRPNRLLRPKSSYFRKKRPRRKP